VFDLEKTIEERRSIRMFLPDRLVPRELIDESLELAIRAPSNSNTQPWHLALASGRARDGLVAAMLHEASTKPPKTIPCPLRSPTCAANSAASSTPRWGSVATTTRGDGSRSCATVSSSARRSEVSSPSIKISTTSTASLSGCLQTFLLALTARGVGTCVQASIADYPEICREHLHIPNEYRILCGLAIGYADPDFPANHLDIPRNPIGENVVFVDS
jgi:nitroreductase